MGARTPYATWGFGMDKSRRRRWALATLAGVTPAAVAFGGIGIADAAAKRAAVSLVPTTKNVVAERYDEGSHHAIDLDLGLSVVAGDQPLEIRAARKSYAQPIVAYRVVVENGVRKQVPMPAGTVTDLSGLKRFSTVTIKNTKGKAVRTYWTDLCLNSYDSVRTRPDAPAQTPYPMGCDGANPFNLGAVWGVQAGWNAPTSDVPTHHWLDLPAGKYTVGVTVNPAYRTAFGIAAKDATVTLNLKVVNASAEKTQARRSAAAAANDHHRHDRAQISTYLPEFRPAAKRPAAGAKATSGPRPDLRSLPAWGISLSPGAKNKWYVNFGATVWNAGTSPLLVDGFRRPNADLMDAYQYFFDAKGNQVGSAQAGTMEWDPRAGHHHWHFTDFAQYNLLRADQKLAVRSGKEAFCLANTDAVDYTVPNAKWRPNNTDLDSACGEKTALGVREVLDIGNGDTYTQERPGQSFDVTGLPNGTYHIQVKANPAGKLAELSTGNNTSLRTIVLGGTAKKRTLTVPPVHGIKG